MFKLPIQLGLFASLLLAYSPNGLSRTKCTHFLTPKRPSLDLYQIPASTMVLITSTLPKLSSPSQNVRLTTYDLLKNLGFERLLTETDLKSLLAKEPLSSKKIKELQERLERRFNQVTEDKTSPFSKELSTREFDHLEEKVLSGITLEEAKAYLKDLTGDNPQKSELATLVLSNAEGKSGEDLAPIWIELIQTSTNPDTPPSFLEKMKEIFKRRNLMTDQEFNFLKNIALANSYKAEKKNESIKETLKKTLKFMEKSESSPYFLVYLTLFPNLRSSSVYSIWLRDLYVNFFKSLKLDTPYLDRVFTSPFLAKAFFRSLLPTHDILFSPYNEATAFQTDAIKRMFQFLLELNQKEGLSGFEDSRETRHLALQLFEASNQTYKKSGEVFQSEFEFLISHLHLIFKSGNPSLHSIQFFNFLERLFEIEERFTQKERDEVFSILAIARKAPYSEPAHLKILEEKIFEKHPELLSNTEFKQIEEQILARIGPHKNNVEAISRISDQERRETLLLENAMEHYNAPVRQRAMELLGIETLLHSPKLMDLMLNRLESTSRPIDILALLTKITSTILTPLFQADRSNLYTHRIARKLFAFSLLDQEIDIFTRNYIKDLQSLDLNPELQEQLESYAKFLDSSTLAPVRTKSIDRLRIWARSESERLEFWSYTSYITTFLGALSVATPLATLNPVTVVALLSGILGGLSGQKLLQAGDRLENSSPLIRGFKTGDHFEKWWIENTSFLNPGDRRVLLNSLIQKVKLAFGFIEKTSKNTEATSKILSMLQKELEFQNKLIIDEASQFEDLRGLERLDYEEVLNDLLKSEDPITVEFAKFHLNLLKPVYSPQPQN